eukprot:TRINITY_DN1577_c0_g1_i1.p1 TRINITY_DN1577_c0_g1~~TRINITY_DN1577_c0_g1_i1.p1  ORF type:complete len:340 (+),score=85.23 TRINITY_DN1577_c0_g1_i1:86-1105(+)
MADNDNEQQEEGESSPNEENVREENENPEKEEENERETTYGSERQIRPKKEKKRKRKPNIKKKRALTKVGEGPHLLETEWTFWYSKKPKTPPTNFEANLQKIGTFNSVQGFWSFYTHMKRPAELQINSDVLLFREGLIPMWESFPQGGSWKLRLKKRSTLLGRMWEELLFAAIGETFDDPSVVGVVLSKRTKEDQVAVWMSQNSVKFKVGQKLKHILHLEPNSPIEYKTNNQSLKQNFTVQQHLQSVNPEKVGKKAEDVDEEQNLEEVQTEVVEQTTDPEQNRDVEVGLEVDQSVENSGLDEQIPDQADLVVDQSGDGNSAVESVKDEIASETVNDESN